MPSTYRRRAQGLPVEALAPSADQPAVLEAEPVEQPLSAIEELSGWTIGDPSYCVICGRTEIAAYQVFVQDVPRYLRGDGALQKQVTVGRCARHVLAPVVPCLTCKCVDTWEAPDGRRICAVCHPDPRRSSA